MPGTGIQVKLKPRHPGKFIHTEILEELGLDTTQTAQMMGVDEQSFAALVNAKTRLTPEMALRIEKAFAISMELLLRLQAWYDTEQMRAKGTRWKCNLIPRLGPPKTDQPVMNATEPSLT